MPSSYLTIVKSRFGQLFFYKNRMRSFGNGNNPPNCHWSVSCQFRNRSIPSIETAKGHIGCFVFRQEKENSLPTINFAPLLRFPYPGYGFLPVWCLASNWNRKKLLYFWKAETSPWKYLQGPRLLEPRWSNVTSDRLAAVIGELRYAATVDFP